MANSFAAIILALTLNVSGGENFLGGRGASGPDPKAKEAFQLYQQGRFAEAARLFRLVRPSSMKKQHYMAWGMAAYNNKKFRSAAARFGQAAAKEKRDGDPLAMMADSFIRARLFVDALDTIRTIKNRKISDRLNLLILWGVAANGAGAPKEALAKYSEAEKIGDSRRTFDIYIGQGLAHYSMGQYDKAEERLNKALAIRKDDPQALSLLGATYLDSGRYLLAEKVIDKAIAKGAPVGPNRYNLACAKARLGKVAEACESLSIARRTGFNIYQFVGKDDDLKNLHGKRCYEFILNTRYGDRGKSE